MRIKWHWLLAITFLVFTGCATVPIYTSDPTTQIVENDLYRVELEPHLASGKNYFDSFRFVFVNKSDRILEMDWKNTFFLKNGVKFGRFGMEEFTVDQLEETREHPRVAIAPGETVSTLIFPLRLIAKRNWTDVSRDEIAKQVGIIPESESGMLLTVRDSERVMREKLVCRIAITEMQKW
jgi:hypothetical protein